MRLNQQRAAAYRQEVYLQKQREMMIIQETTIRLRLVQAQRAQVAKAKAAAEVARIEIRKAAAADEIARAQSEGARTKAAVASSIEKALEEQQRLAKIKANEDAKQEEKERLEREKES